MTKLNKSQRGLYMSEKGVISLGDFGDLLIKQYHFKTYRDTKEMLFYDGGVYKELGDTYIGEESRAVFKGLIKHNQISELTSYISDCSLTDRKGVNKYPHVVNLKNCLYNIKTKTFCDHNPDIIETAQIPVKFDKEAKCPNIEKFFSEIVSKEDIKLLYQLIGYALYKESNLKICVFLLGSGDNGKSVLLNLINRFLGKENISHIAMQDLNNRFSTVDLYGKYANLYADLSHIGLKDTGMFKQTVGGDIISGEYKHIHKKINFEPYALQIYSCNTIPPTPDKTVAFYNRIRIIDFPNTFTKETWDINLIDKLTTPEELSGLLNKAIEALNQVLLDKHFINTPTTKEIRDKYERFSNVLFDFLNTYYEPSVNGFVYTTDFRDDYYDYCSRLNKTPISEKEFGSALQSWSINIHKSQEGGRRIWRGIIPK